MFSNIIALRIGMMNIAYYNVIEHRYQN